MPAVSKKQQKFFGIVRAIQKGEMAPTTPETAKAAEDMKKGDVKKFASTKHKGLPEKKVTTEESNPRIPRKKGQPANSKKHSDLYTDENPKGTIHGLGFKNVAKAKASVSKIRNSSRSHAHKIQAAVAMEQRAREMGKTSEAAVYRKFINSMKKKTKRMNEKVEYTANDFEKLKKKIGSKKKHDIPSIEEGWSDKYKKSIDCNNPKGFSQKAHCQGKKKKLKDITEGMTTTNAYSIVLPARGNVDLDTLQLGATGSDLTYTPNTLDSVVDGEFTSLTNTDAIDNVNDPHDMGTNVRTPQPTNQTTFTANDISHTGAAPGVFPPYKPGDTGGTRGVGISGQYNIMQDPSYRASQGPTNENIPINDVNSFDGNKFFGDGGIVGTHTFWGSGAGAIAGFPRFAALKAVDTTEMDTLTMNWFMYGGYGVDTEEGSPTEGETVTLTSSKFSQPGDGVVVYYWAGDKEGAKSFAPSVTGMSKRNDGWRPINVKPDGTTDNSYDPYLIPHKPDGANYNSGARQKHVGGYPSNVLLNNKLTLPPWCRDKNTRFLLHQGTNSSGANKANFGITSIRFQRQNAQTISVKLDSPEGSNFVRGGIIDGKATTPEERKKRVADILKLSSQYVTNKFGKGFPGQPTTISGDKEFDTKGFKNFKGISKEFTEETKIEEQISFPQMQQRIRDAKEKRRNQRKESEKLYMDTKRKGVKFFDKKGTGRIRDGKKIYD